MRRQTENYKLNKSDGLQVDFYENMEIIDAELKRLDEKIGQGGGGTVIDGFTDDELARIKAKLEWEAAELNKEYWTGKYHVDGKKIYGKIIDCGQMPSNGATKTIPHNIVNCNKVVKLYGRQECSGIEVPLPRSSSNTAVNVDIRRNGLNLLAVVGASDQSAYTFTLTVEYTCTDR